MMDVQILGVLTAWLLALVPIFGENRAPSGRGDRCLIPIFDAADLAITLGLLKLCGRYFQLAFAGLDRSFGAVFALMDMDLNRRLSGSGIMPPGAYFGGERLHDLQQRFDLISWQGFLLSDLLPQLFIAP